MATSRGRTVAVVAGRRVDAPGTEAPFPFENVSLVQTRLTEFFLQNNVCKLVSSAACGADLVALKVARIADVQSRIVLPYDELTFLRSSVLTVPAIGRVCSDRLSGKRNRRES